MGFLLGLTIGLVIGTVASEPLKATGHAVSAWVRTFKR